MREMKDSGIEWIGEIPESWGVSKIKHHLRRNEPRNPGGCTVLSLYRELGIVPKDSREDNHNVTSLDTSNYKYVKVGDFVINKMKAWQGSVAVSSYEGIVSPAYYVYNFLDNVFDKLYFHYLLRSCYKDEFRRLSGGIREGQWDLSSESFDNTLVLIPPLPEQQKISAYLDRQCELIDSVIEKTKASIEEYKKLRQAVITQAVTKGVRGDRPMKDSGIEGLGNIPDNWIIAPIKRILIEITDRTLTGEGNPLSVNQKKGVVPASESGAANPSQSTVDWRIVSVNDIVFNKYKAHSGVFFVSQYEGIVTFNYSVFRCINGNNPKFFEYLFKTNWCIGEFRKQMHGVGDSISPLYTRDLFKINIIIPSLDEQKEIVTYLDQKCAEIDSLISKKEQFLTELEAYKKSLIYEYVTGKKEVPQA